MLLRATEAPAAAQEADPSAPRGWSRWSSSGSQPEGRRFKSCPRYHAGAPNALFAFRASIFSKVGRGRARGAYRNLAGEENGLAASTTNIIGSRRSVEPQLEIWIGVSPPGPASVRPAETRVTPWGARMQSSPVST